MTATQPMYDAKSFGEFWEHYQLLHANPRTRALHAVATASAIGTLALAVARRNPWIALLAPVLDYSIAQLAHRELDHTKTHPLKKPWWHARAEWRLFRQTLDDAQQRIYDKL